MEPIPKGILAIAARRAALYDVIFDRWLMLLDSGNEDLKGGEGE